MSLAGRIASGCVIAAGLCGAVSAAGAPALRWAEALDRGPGIDLPVAAVQSRSRVHVLLVSASAAGHTDWWLQSRDAASGALLVEDVFDGGADDLPRALALGQGRLFAAGASHAAGALRMRARAYDEASGALLWEDDAEGREGAYQQVAARGGRVVLAASVSFAGFDAALLRVLDARSGALVWEQIALGSPESLLADGPAVYLWTRSLFGDQLQAFGFADGRALWTEGLAFAGAPARRRVGALARKGRTLLAGASLEGEPLVIALDARSGSPRWGYEPPTIRLRIAGTADGQMRLLCRGRRVHVVGAVTGGGAPGFVGARVDLDLATGEPLATTPLLGGPFALARRGRELLLAGVSAPGDDLWVQSSDAGTGATLFSDVVDEGSLEMGLGAEASGGTLVVTGMHDRGAGDYAALLRVYGLR